MKASLKSLSLLTATVLSLFSSCVSAHVPPIPGDTEDLSRAIEERVDEFQRKYRITGLSVAVVARGETVASFGRGWADRENKRLISDTTPMPVGSVTKVITSLAIVQLARQGLLDLNAPVGLYLPELKLADGAENRITLAQLCSHHSGLPGDLASGWFIDKPGLDEMRRYPILLENAPLVNEPGRLHAYSNMGYALLGLVIERVSGRSYDRYLREEIFVPAGMNDALTYPDPGDSRLPLGYRDGEAVSVPLIRDIPAGSVLLSARDGAAFIKALFPEPDKEGVVDSQGLRQLITSQNGDVSRDGHFSIGMGFWLNSPLDLNVPVAHHGGDLPPFHSFLMTLPEQRSGILVSTNHEGGDMTSLVEDLTAILTGWLELNPQKAVPPPKREWLPGERENWVGSYPAFALGTMVIEEKKGALILTLQDTPLYLIPREEGCFTLEYRFLGIPLTAIEGIRIELFSHGKERWLSFWSTPWFCTGNFRRIEEAIYPADFNRFSGRYEVLDPKDKMVMDSLSIYQKGDRYYMEDGLNRYPLRSVAENRAVIDGEGRGIGQEILFEEGDEGMTLRYSGVSLRRVSE